MFGDYKPSSFGVHVTNGDHARMPHSSADGASNELQTPSYEETIERLKRAVDNLRDAMVYRTWSAHLPIPDKFRLDMDYLSWEKEARQYIEQFPLVQRPAALSCLLSDEAIDIVGDNGVFNTTITEETFAHLRQMLDRSVRRSRRMCHHDPLETPINLPDPPKDNVIGCDQLNPALTSLIQSHETGFTAPSHPDHINSCTGQPTNPAEGNVCNTVDEIMPMQCLDAGVAFEEDVHSGLPDMSCDCEQCPVWLFMPSKQNPEIDCPRLLDTLDGSHLLSPKSTTSRPTKGVVLIMFLWVCPKLFYAPFHYNNYGKCSYSSDARITPVEPFWNWKYRRKFCVEHRGRCSHGGGAV